MRRRSLRTRVALGALAVGAAFWTADKRLGVGISEEGVVVLRNAERPWTLVDGKHWQITSEHTEDPSVTDEAEGTRGVCAAGMVEVRGTMKRDSPQRGPVEFLQDETCTHWISRDFPARCEQFDQEKWVGLSRDLPTTDEHFCMDRYEYPNLKGAYPVILVTWHEAEALCQVRSERLCTEDEWTFACEGEQATPYPYGYERDENACVIDRAWRQYDDRAFANRGSDVAKNELDYLWDGEASGARPKCRSSFGVYDMTGNVDEWTRSTEHEGYMSIFKGGYWGPVRARCRASTRAHNEDFMFYQQGFRCCGDVPAPEDGGSPE
jgi:sulfatase modifying factor 1